MSDFDIHDISFMIGKDLGWIKKYFETMPLNESLKKGDIILYDSQNWINKNPLEIFQFHVFFIIDNDANDTTTYSVYDLALSNGAIEWNGRGGSRQPDEGKMRFNERQRKIMMRYISFKAHYLNWNENPLNLK